MSKPRLLDLFSGAGGCGQGYALAGFEVVGVDIVHQKNYPFEFYEDNALTVLDVLLEGREKWNGYTLDDFEVIHQSPECKGYTHCNLSPKERYLKLIGDVRKRVRKTGKPYIIENVMGAAPEMYGNLLLCGTMFDLPMERHRMFESNVWLREPGPCNHAIAHIGVYGHSVWDSWLPGTPRKDGRKRPDSVPLEVGKQAMGIDWMGIEELAEAIPPAYTEWIGLQLMAHLEEQAA